MFGMSIWEIAVIMAVALIFIGPQKLPDLAKSLGRALGEFKRATNDFKDSIRVDNEINEVRETFNDLGRETKEVIEMKTVPANTTDTPDTGQAVEIASESPAVTVTPVPADASEPTASLDEQNESPPKNDPSVEKG